MDFDVEGERHIAIASDFVGQIGRNRQKLGNKMVTMLAMRAKFG